MTGSDPASAGWHPDPTEPHLLRYWDGTGWTPHTAAAAASAREPDAELAHAAEEPAMHATTRMPEPLSDTTTVPLRPETPWVGPIAHPAVRLLTAASVLTAVASFVVACAALGVALGG
ncbi:DUF2510 domain-containing protein [Agromyces sp. GXS1127]|uniref:DUF2510 domain-containing protein n=1 Tax=Agromyces sp. GXS1127 TaxID=3424181 RepID=UPI003D3111DC